MGFWVSFRDPHYGSTPAHLRTPLRVADRCVGSPQPPAVEARNLAPRVAFLFRQFESMRQFLVPIQFTVSRLNFSLRIFQHGPDLVTGVRRLRFPSSTALPSGGRDTAT